MSQVKELCRERVDMEGDLCPHAENVYGVKYKAFVLGNEGVFAYPQAPKEFGDGEGCNSCRSVGRQDIRFHVVFQPRAYMAPAYVPSPPIHQGPTRPWDICPPFHLLGQVGIDQAKARVQQLAAVYGDYAPSFVGCAPGYEEAVEAGRRHTKKVPKQVAEVRRKTRAAK